MKLSEAIRLGAMLHPQRFNDFAAYRGKDGRFCRSGGDGATVIATCAIGAAREAGYRIMLNLKPLIAEAYYRCPDCEHLSSLEGMAVHLNDEHRWTREAIADFIETCERSLEDVSPGRDDVCVVSESDALTRS